MSNNNNEVEIQDNIHEGFYYVFDERNEPPLHEQGFVRFEKIDFDTCEKVYLREFYFDNMSDLLNGFNDVLSFADIHMIRCYRDNDNNQDGDNNENDENNANDTDDVGHDVVVIGPMDPRDENGRGINADDRRSLLSYLAVVCNRMGNDITMSCANTDTDGSFEFVEQEELEPPNPIPIEQRRERRIANRRVARLQAEQSQQEMGEEERAEQWRVARERALSQARDIDLGRNIERLGRQERRDLLRRLRGEEGPEQPRQ